MTSADTDLGLETLVRQMLDELRLIRQALERDRKPSTLTRADRAMLARILPAIAGTLGSDTFTASEVLESEQPALRLVTNGLSAKHLGQLFRRAIGVPLEGLVVERAGEELHRNLWRIVAAV